MIGATDQNDGDRASRDQNSVELIGATDQSGVRRAKSIGATDHDAPGRPWTPPDAPGGAERRAGPAPNRQLPVPNVVRQASCPGTSGTTVSPHAALNTGSWVHAVSAFALSKAAFSTATAPPVNVAQR